MDSMEEVYLKHAKTVYGFLLTRTRDPDLAEELTQETFYQAVKSIGRFDGQSSLSTWLCAIAKNVWRDDLRKKQRSPGSEADSCELMDSSVPSAESQAFHSWDEQRVMQAVHELSEPMREVMYLRLSGNLTFAQIGQILGRTENWARVTYYRGKEKVVKEVQDDRT